MLRRGWNHLGHEITVISTGNELIYGNSADSNSSWLAARLYEDGFEAARFLVLPDDPDRLYDEIVSILNRPEKQLVLMSGGLGPTEDDYTLESILKIAGPETKTVASASDKLSARRENGSLTDEQFRFALRQTMIPAGSEPLDNFQGIAPGFILEIGNNRIVCFPGVPVELKYMYAGHKGKILEGFESSFTHASGKYLWNMSESRFQLEFIEKNRDRIGKSVQWGVAPKKGFLKVSFRSTDPKALEGIVAEFEKFYGEKQTGDILHELHEIARKKHFKIGIAESCTGGLLGKMITDMPGSSEYFLGSIVSYDNSIKNNILGVKPETLAAHGAVSPDTAAEMAEGARNILGADFTAGITGIAGPGGGSPEKPVGLVFISVAGPKKTEVFRHVFGTDREKNRELAAFMTLYYLYREMSSC